jgi:hypothetical protein
MNAMQMLNMMHLLPTPPFSHPHVPLEPLLHASSDRPQVAIHLARLLTQDQADDTLTRNVDVLETAENMNLLICQDDTCTAGVFDGELGLAVLAWKGC